MSLLASTQVEASYLKVQIVTVIFKIESLLFSFCYLRFVALNQSITSRLVIIRSTSSKKIQQSIVLAIVAVYNLVGFEKVFLKYLIFIVSAQLSLSIESRSLSNSSQCSYYSYPTMCFRIVSYLSAFAYLLVSTKTFSSCIKKALGSFPFSLLSFSQKCYILTLSQLRRVSQIAF